MVDIASCQLPTISLHRMDYQQQGQAMAGQYVDPYANDIARHLSVAGASSSEDVIASLRSMNLGDNFWMHSFKVRVAGPRSRKAAPTVAAG